MEPVLSVHDLTKTFSRPGQTELTAVNHISFDLRPGECLGIIGESGSGKSTTVNLITRLLDATAGTILLDGEDITFLRRIVRGPADDSYGIEVAKLSGLPGSVTLRAHEVLRALEATAPKNKVEQMDFDALQEYNSPAVPSEMMDKLEALDVETLTPIEALNFLYELKKTLKGSLNR